MSKVRINDLARELEVKSRQILDALEYLNLAEGKTHTSSIEASDAERVRSYFKSGYHRAATRSDQGNRSKINFSNISKPGDIMKAILARKREAELKLQNPQPQRIEVQPPESLPKTATPNSRNESINVPGRDIRVVTKPSDARNTITEQKAVVVPPASYQQPPATVVVRPPEDKSIPMKPGASVKLVTLKGECFEVIFLSQQDNLYDRAGALYKYQIDDLTDKARGKRLVSVYRFGVDELSGTGRDAQLDTILLNAIRRSFDAGGLSFDSHYDKHRYQEISLEWDSSQPRGKASGQDIQDLIRHAAYWIAFRLSTNPTDPISFESPTDLEYLGVSALEVHRYVHLMGQRGLLEKVMKGLGRPTHRLIDDYEAEPKQTATVVKIDSYDEWDVFISHATEDKEEVARPLAEALTRRSLRVWYDESALTVGDSLRKKIDEGLAKSRFGVIILSPSFFNKHWPEQELNGLTAREVNGVKVILPIWHKVAREDVLRYSPILADKLASSTAKGLDSIVRDLLTAIRK